MLVYSCTAKDVSEHRVLNCSVGVIKLSTSIQHIVPPPPSLPHCTSSSRLIQQALMERKQFEEKQQQLAALHLRQQQELQKKQQLLRQMQEAQLLNIQRQILIQNMAHQQRVSETAGLLVHVYVTYTVCVISIGGSQCLDG